MPVPGRAKDLLREAVLLGRQCLVLPVRHPLAPAQRTGARRGRPLVWSEDQLERVARDMLRLQRDRGAEHPAPALERLAGDGIDEVDAQVLQPGRAGGTVGIARLAHAVAAGQGDQVVVIERLDAERDPCYARGPEAGPIRPLAGRGVRLEGDLPGDATPSVLRGSQHPIHSRRRQQRGRAAPEVDRLEAPRRGTERQLGNERVQVAWDGVAATAHRHEVAVGAHQPAERDVDIEVMTAHARQSSGLAHPVHHRESRPAPVLRGRTRVGAG